MTYRWMLLSYWRVTDCAYDTRCQQIEITQYEEETLKRWSRTRSLYDSVGNKTETYTSLTQADDDYGKL